MKSPDELLAEVIAEARKLKIPVSDMILPRVKINSRAVSRFGCCTRRPDGRYEIELSARLLEASEHMQRRTLAHEVLHTCYGCRRHGQRWKLYAERMNAAYGYSISRTGSYEKAGIEPPETKYLVVCTSCGAEFKRMKMSSLVQHPERYRCRCGGDLQRKR